MKRCGRCRFSTKGPDHLYCHLLPPTPLADDAGNVSFLFPAVRPESWCSFFKLSLMKLFKGDGTRT